MNINEDMCLIIIVCGTVIFLFLLLFYKRFQEKMAALITWFVGSMSARLLIGDKKKQDSKATQEDPGSSNANSEIQKKSKLKSRQRKKQYEDPKFNTNLKTPIEEILEETISESLTISFSSKKKEKSDKTKVKESIKSKDTFNEQERTDDNVGLSLIKETSKDQKNERIVSKAQGKLNSNTDPPVDDIGFSFFPVKEKGRKYRSKSYIDKPSEESLEAFQKRRNLRITKDDLAKPQTTDQNKYKRSKNAVIEPLPVVTKKFTSSLEKIQNFVVVNPIEEKVTESQCSKSILKETKKVTSTVSYASIVTNKISDTSQIETKELEKSDYSFNSVNTEIGSEITESFIEIDTDIIDDSSNVEDNSELDPAFYVVDSELCQEETIVEEPHRSETTTDSSTQDSSFHNLDSFQSSDTNSSYKSVEIIEEPKYQVTNNHNFEETEQERVLLNGKYIINSEGQDKKDSVTFIHSECSPKNTERKEISQSIDIHPNFEKHNIEPALKIESFIDNQIEPDNETFLDVLEPEEKKPIHFSNRGDNIDDQNLFREILNESDELNLSNKTLEYFSEFKSEVTEKTNDQQIKTECKTSSTLSDDDVLKNIQNQIVESDLINNSVPKQKSNLKKESENFIEEEKCVKRFAYKTGSIDEQLKETQPLIKELKRSKSSKLNLEIMRQIRVLTLNDKEHQECTLYRLEKNWIIQFRLGPSLFGRKVYLYCNYPTEKNGSLEEFKRDKYQLLPWIFEEGCKNADDTAAYTQISVSLAGSFHYYFTFREGINSKKEGSGYFLVDPTLIYGNNEELPLDCIQCQTVLAKNLGSFTTWENKLKVAKESGYNMIHFTPIQELGVSNSCYSLSEQLKLNPLFKKENGTMPTFDELEKFGSKLRNDWKITSICDIVLNHTANESEWIKVHPEVTYNCINCPYMRPSYLLDAAIYQFSIDVKKGFYEDKGIPAEINSEDHLNAIRYHFNKSVLEPLNIPELFLCNVTKYVAEFLNLARTNAPRTIDYNEKIEELTIIQDPEYRRLSSKVDIQLALKMYNVYRNDTFDEDSRLKRCSEDLKNKLDSLNNAVIEEVKGHLNVAVENIIAGIRYYRVQADGPRFEDITVKTPLVYRYFTDYGQPTSLKEHEEIMYTDKGAFLMAHNGWVMNCDPLKNFAAADSKVYLRRELIAWGDSVKLRFGDKPEDCPFLWEHMKKYVEQTAKIFDGVRLDNCHSTPIPVAEYLLDCARRVKPNLYVVAELFTNSDMTDNVFVNRLGITSLIREAMSAWNSHEEGRLVYRYGGYPVGAFYQPSIRPLVPSIAHALFLDLTHDNPSPIEKRSVFDMLPSTALVNMACCASGSNRGYDELVPHHIHVVDENREYTEWANDDSLAKGNTKFVTKNSGIISAKKALNDLHFVLGKEGYNQVYVDQIDPDIVAVTRHCPNTHQSYILVAFTAFGHPPEDTAKYQRGIKALRFEGVLDEIVLEATLSHISEKSGGSKYMKFPNFVKDSTWINGLSEYKVTVRKNIQVTESEFLENVESGVINVTQLNFKHFKPGSVVVIKTSLPHSMKNAVASVRHLIDSFSLSDKKELYEIVSKLSLADLNRVLYRCDKEERDEGYGFDTYNIPSFGFMVYAGLQGMMSLLSNIRPNNDLGHPMCANLRDGNWMIDYIWRRLQFDVGTKPLGDWIETNVNCLKEIPRYLIPCYFDVIVTGIYILLLEHSYSLMSDLVKQGSTFVKGLSLGSLQMAGYIKSADLPTLTPDLVPPKPPTRNNDKGEVIQACVTLAAGLPHFAVGYMRNWGRDTFISLRGLFILTGRYQEAREHILGYAACLRHGLIPNLLDGGRNSRYNCRDAIWWWLYCIKEYVQEAPNGITIFSDKVSRIFPTDDSPALPAGMVDQLLQDIIQEALTVHFQGLVFRERNAGRQIDEHMSDAGFNNQIGIHPETGFVFGGNQWNCGTWMDKMGSSDKAGNRGKPATPRDGSAIELIGLSKAVITWLDKLYTEQKYPYSGVDRTHKNGSKTHWTFKEWSEKIQSNFEKFFWINSAPVDGEIRPDLINKRGIYKDTFGSNLPWTDYQLRCNFPIAMVVAPELFNFHHAWTALEMAETYLLGPLGMKTLDPEDWAYRGDYDNSNDSNDPTVANGFNYHQGPEWVWPIGFFLRAKLHFANQNGVLKETLASTKLILSKHFVELQTSAWRGLPELTNSNGSYCKDSSSTQAWSMSCIMEVLHDLQKIESKGPISLN